MNIGTIQHAGYIFTVYDDGSLGCARTWYEDAPTAARELNIPAEPLSALVVQTLRAWAGDPSRGAKAVL